MRMILGGKWAPLKLIAIVALPLCILDHLRGRSYPKCVPNENLRQNHMAADMRRELVKQALREADADA